MTIPNPAGHQVVAPGEDIDSDWGNHAWNQSVQRFASTADRDTQLTAPPDGSVCYTIAEKAFWNRVNGAWYAAAAPTQPGPPVVGSVKTGPSGIAAGYSEATTNAQGLLAITLSPAAAVVLAGVAVGAVRVGGHPNLIVMLRVDASTGGQVVFQFLNAAMAPLATANVAFSYVIAYQP